MDNKKRYFVSLKTKAALMALIAGLVIIYLSNFYFSAKAEKILYRYSLQRMNALAQLFALNASQGKLLQNRGIAERLCYSVNEDPDVLFALVIDEDKKIFAGNYAGIPGSYFKRITEVLSSSEKDFSKKTAILEEETGNGGGLMIQPIYSASMKATVGSGFIEDQGSVRKILGYSVIAFSLENIKTEIRAMRTKIVALLSVALVLIIIVFYALVTLLTRNLRRLLEAASRLEKGDLTARVNIQSHDEIEELADGFNKMAGQMEDSNTELKDALVKIQQSSLETIYRLSLAAEYRDWDTGHHLLRMSHYAKAIAKEMDLEPKYTEAILYASLMHDVGKIGIPDNILRKPGKLTPQEWDVMKQHTVIGAQILERSEAEFIKMAEGIALSHHERWDGSGYPRGLKGDEISLAARIVAVADVFEAITSKRPYKEAFSVETAFNIIKEGRGTHFDPTVVDAFFEIKDEILNIKNRDYHPEDPRIHDEK
ncbi:MAG: HD domain-containing protein [Candidatus Tantalella remota]|nr:HD domain-containing protein [Candidatus Tantalella remota]